MSLLSDTETLLQLAYLAGLFDGEGCIQIRRAGGVARQASCLEAGLCLYIQVTNTNILCLGRFRRRYGGGIYINRRKKVRPANHRMAKTWVVAGKRAANVLVDLLPYLRIKKQQARIALLFAETYYPEWRQRFNRITEQAAILRRITYLAFRRVINRQGGRGKTHYSYVSAR